MSDKIRKYLFVNYHSNNCFRQVTVDDKGVRFYEKICSCKKLSVTY